MSTTTRELILSPEEVKQKLGIPDEEEIHNFQMWVDYQGYDCIESIRFVWKTEIQKNEKISASGDKV